ncbi:MAG: glycosyltransferase family 4 protein [Chloroflexota bacterium]
MKVVHVSPLYFNEEGVIGGGERYALELARAMSSRVPTKLVTFGKKRQSLVEGDLRIEIYPAWFHFGGKNVNPVSLTFLRELSDVDVIHLHQYRIALSDIVVLFARAFRKPVFASDHGGGGRNYAHRLKTDDYVTGFLLVSNYLAQQYARHAHKTRIIYGGFNPKLFYPREVPRQRKAIFTGRLIPFKGINYLVEGIDPDIELHLIGRAYHPEYYELLQKLAQGKRVAFQTALSQEELAVEYSSAMVNVLPSVYLDCYGTHHKKSEILGLVLLEAMACGAPVLVSRVGGMPELVPEGEVGFIVPPNDPAALGERIRYLHDNPEVAARMGQAAREHALANFTWDRVALTCLKAYEEMRR